LRTFLVGDAGAPTMACRAGCVGGSRPAGYPATDCSRRRFFPLSPMLSVAGATARHDAVRDDVASSRPDLGTPRVCCLEATIGRGRPSL